MKKIILLAVTAVTMAACGGGSGIGKTGSKKNEFLGKIPALYAGIMPLEKEAEKKHQEMMRRIEEDSFTEDDFKSYEKEREKMAAIYDKFKDEMKIEAEKINGADVPFTCSDAFEQLPYEIASLTFHVNDLDITNMLISVIAKQDFNQRSLNLYYRVVTKDGSIISRGEVNVFSFNTKLFTKGQILHKDEFISIELTVHEIPECWMDFAKIEIITREEYVQSLLSSCGSESGDRGGIDPMQVAVDFTTAFYTADFETVKRLACDAMLEQFKKNGTAKIDHQANFQSARAEGTEPYGYNGKRVNLTIFKMGGDRSILRVYVIQEQGRWVVESIGM